MLAIAFRSWHAAQPHQRKGLILAGPASDLVGRARCALLCRDGCRFVFGPRSSPFLMRQRSQSVHALDRLLCEYPSYARLEIPPAPSSKEQRAPFPIRRVSAKPDDRISLQEERCVGPDEPRAAGVQLPGSVREELIMMARQRQTLVHDTARVACCFLVELRSASFLRFRNADAQQVLRRVSDWQRECFTENSASHRALARLDDGIFRRPRRSSPGSKVPGAVGKTQTFDRMAPPRRLWDPAGLRTASGNSCSV